MVVDPLPGRAKQVAEEFGINQYSVDVLDACQSKEIDALLVVTPTSTHAAIIQLAASYGNSCL